MGSGGIGDGRGFATLDAGASGTVGQWREFPVRIQSPDALQFRCAAPGTFDFLDNRCGLRSDRRNGDVPARSLQRLARQRKHPLASIVPEQPIVSDLGESLGQDVQGESVEEAESLRCSMRWSSHAEISVFPRSAGVRLWKRDNWMIQSV